MGYTIMIPDQFYFFCVHKNITSFINKGDPEDLEKKLFYLIYDRQKDFIKEAYKKIWNEWENGFFTVEEYKIYLLYNYLFKKSFFVNSIKVKEIKDTCKLFSDEQWIKDKEVVSGICKNINIKNVKDFLNIKMEDGTGIAENLVKESKISPMILINYSDKIEFKLERTKTIINKIKQILTKNKQGL